MTIIRWAALILLLTITVVIRIITSRTSSLLLAVLDVAAPDSLPGAALAAGLAPPSAVALLESLSCSTCSSRRCEEAGFRWTHKYYICIHTYIYLHTRRRIYIYIYIYIFVYIYIYICRSARELELQHVLVQALRASGGATTVLMMCLALRGGREALVRYHTHNYIPICIHTYINTYVFIYIYIYIYI